MFLWSSVTFKKSSPSHPQIQKLLNFKLTTMKSIKSLFLSLVLILAGFTAFAQTTGSGNVIGQSFDVSGFDGISISGVFNVELIQSDDFSLYIETDDNLFDKLDIDVSNAGILYLGVSNTRKITQLKATITMPQLKSVEASGATHVKTANTFSGDVLRLEVSGAANASLDLQYQKLLSELSGAAKIKLSGSAETHKAELSGAAKLTANTLKTSSTTIDASGASNAYIAASESLYVETSGAAKVSYDEKPKSFTSNKDSNVQQGSVRTSPFRDTVNVKVGNIKVQVIEGDSTQVRVGDRVLVVDDNGNVEYKREKKHRFNGHWAGVELGLNGLLTPDFNMSYPAGQEYLDLRMEKSINLNLNFFEQNISLNKSGTFGMVSGLGLTWNNYRFANDVMLTGDSAVVKGYYMEGVSVRKSKLTNVYLTVPLYFEVQSKATRTKEKLHFAAGVVVGWRIKSHTKLYFNEDNKVYRLRDPETDQLLPVAMQSPGNNDRNISKNFDSFYMRPFKADASIRAGWGIVNLYANYSLTSLFIKDKGPDVYPFAVGIALSGW